MLLLMPPPSDETKQESKVVRKRLREQIAEAIAHAGHGLSPTELAIAVEAELLVLGFDARVLPLEGRRQQPLPLAM